MSSFICGCGSGKIDYKLCSGPCHAVDTYYKTYLCLSCWGASNWCGRCLNFDTSRKEGIQEPFTPGSTRVSNDGKGFARILKYNLLSTKTTRGTRKRPGSTANSVVGTAATSLATGVTTGVAAGVIGRRPTTPPLPDSLLTSGDWKDTSPFKSPDEASQLMRRIRKK